MRASVVVLSLCMLLTGTINTIATKYQDITVIGTLPDGTPLTFKHPAVQSACMFLGESLCLIPYFYIRWRRRKAKRKDPAYVPMPAEEKKQRRISRILAFAVPTLCDATGTTLMNVGLIYTYASTYQMLRGTLVLFAGMFTILILRRQLYIHHWLGMVLITAGAALVGASSVLYQGPTGQNSTLQMALGQSTAAQEALNSTDAMFEWSRASSAFGSSSSHALHYDASLSRVASRGMLGADNTSPATAISSSNGGGWRGVLAGVLRLQEGGADVAAAPLFGDVLVVAAQMFTALQFIMEEKFLVKYKVPALLAVGLEGCWGLVLCSFVLPITSLVKGSDGLPLDDAVEAVKAILSNTQLGLAVYSSILSIAFFNFFGVSVTKSLSGAARATIDACRTLFIWLYAMHAGWESFHMLEVLGFVVLISGTSLYNEILKSCLPGSTVVTEHVPPMQPRRRTRPSAPGAATNGAGDLAAPLLSPEEAPQHSTAAAVPLQRPAPAHQRVYDAAQSGSGSWVYTMARSMRLGMHALSPQSLLGGGVLAGEDVESGSESEVGSYMSTTPGSYLGASLGREAATSAGGALRGSGSGYRPGRSPGSGVDSGTEVVLGFGLGGGVTTGAAGTAGVRKESPLPPAARPGVGGLSASFRAREAAAAGAAAGASGSSSTGSGGGVRRNNSGKAVKRSVSFEGVTP